MHGLVMMAFDEFIKKIKERLYNSKLRLIEAY